MTARPGGGDPAVYGAHVQTPSGPMPLEVECRICGEPARFPLAYCLPCRDAVLRGETKTS